jgi:hypothetical protein
MVLATAYHSAREGKFLDRPRFSSSKAVRVWISPFMSRTLYQDDEGSRGEFLRLLAEQGEEPSFLRRAKAVHDAWESLLRACLAHRDEKLRGPRMHLGNLARQLNGDWSRLASFLVDEHQVGALAALYQQWKPRLPTVVKSSSPWSTIRSSLIGFVDSGNRFNGAWTKFLRDVDLDGVNRLRSDYNQYYPIEKAAAFDSEDVERLGFTPLEIATVEHLQAKFPLLELPVLLRR